MHEACRVTEKKAFRACLYLSITMSRSSNYFRAVQWVRIVRRKSQVELFGENFITVFKLERLKRNFNLLVNAFLPFHMSGMWPCSSNRDNTKQTYNQRAEINAKSNKLSPRDWISKHTKNGISEKNVLALTEVEAGRLAVCKRMHLTTPDGSRNPMAFFFETINRFHKRHKKSYMCFAISLRSNMIIIKIFLFILIINLFTFFSLFLKAKKCIWCARRKAKREKRKSTNTWEFLAKCLKNGIGQKCVERK